MRRSCALLVAFACTWPASGAGPNGEFQMGGGAGGVTCPEYRSVMHGAREHAIGSVPYVTQTQAFSMYVLGFQTGFNSSADGVCDVFNDITADQVLEWVDNYCQANPLKKFSHGVISLARERASSKGRGCGS